MEPITTWDSAPPRGHRVMLVTGANGFVGGAVAARAAREPGSRVKGSVRRGGVHPITGVELVMVTDLAADTDWSEAVRGVDVVVHAAARVHVMQDSAADPLEEFRRVNVAGTVSLARRAAAAGVRRFVFISSIKANGEQTAPGRPYTVGDSPAPIDPYGISKLEAERALRDLAAETGIEVAIIRPVLVYGPGVGGNFLAIMRALAKGIPLPLGSVRNRRSLVYLDNLVDLVLKCASHPAAAGGTFLVSDGEDLSTTDLLRRTAVAMGREARLIPVPERLLSAAAAMVGKRAVAQRLLGSLQVDMSATKARLGWEPPVGVDAGLRQTARHYLASVDSSDSSR